MPAQVPADHDDHHGRDARCHSAGDGARRRLGAAPSARHRDRRRADREPDADALYDAGDLSLSRSLQPVVPTPLVFRTIAGRRLWQSRAGRMKADVSAMITPLREPNSDQPVPTGKSICYSLAQRLLTTSDERGNAMAIDL